MPLQSSILYGLLAAPLAMVGVFFYITLPKLYADHFGVSLTVIGLVTLLSRIWDAVLDPAIGSWSDRTRHPYGRRRLWIAIGLLPLALCTTVLLAPAIVAPISPTIVFVFGSFLFFLFWSVITIPYDALGTEVARGYNEKTLLFSIRQGWLVVGTLLAGALPLILSSFGVIDPVWASEWLGILGAVLLVLSGVLLLWKIKEPPAPKTTSSQYGLRDAVRCARKNTPFLYLLAAYVVSGFGAALPAGLIYFYVEYVLHGTNTPLYLTIYFVVGFLFLPLWVYLSHRIGKKTAWILSMAVNSGAFLFVFLLGAGDLIAYGWLVALSGVGYGGALALPVALQADVLDYEAYHRGDRREGQFLALWAMANKLAAALGAGIAFPILEATGYVAGANQNENTIFALRALYAGVPSLCNLAAVLIALKFPLTREESLRIEEALRKG